MVKLTHKQRRFIDEYLIDLNATQAAIRAGYSKKSAARISVELLNKTQVSESLQNALKQREERTEITQDRVLRELADVAFSKLPDCADTTLKYKLKALELLGKHLAIFDQRQDVKERVVGQVQIYIPCNGRDKK